MPPAAYVLADRAEFEPLGHLKTIGVVTKRSDGIRVARTDGDIKIRMKAESVARFQKGLEGDIQAPRCERYH